MPYRESGVVINDVPKQMMQFYDVLNKFGDITLKKQSIAENQSEYMVVSKFQTFIGELKEELSKTDTEKCKSMVVILENLGNLLNMYSSPKNEPIIARQGTPLITFSTGGRRKRKSTKKSTRKGTKTRRSIKKSSKSRSIKGRARRSRK